MGKKGKMNKLFDERYIRNRRYDAWNTVQKEDVLSLILQSRDITVLGVLVMNNILVLPLRLN